MLNLADKLDLRPLAALIRDLRAAAPDADVMLVGAMAPACVGAMRETLHN